MPDARYYEGYTRAIRLAEELLMLHTLKHYAPDSFPYAMAAMETQWSKLADTMQYILAQPDPVDRSATEGGA